MTTKTLSQPEQSHILREQIDVALRRYVDFGSGRPDFAGQYLKGAGQ